MNETPVIHTSRLSLRGHVPSDLPQCLSMWGEPEYYRFNGGRALSQEEVWLRLLRYWGSWAALGYGWWLIEERGTGRFVGEVGIHDLKRDTEPSYAGEPEVGWGLLPDFHGQGLAREAVAAVLEWASSLPVPRLVCVVKPENFRSIKLAEDVGFVREGEVAYKWGPMVLFSRRQT